MIAPALIATMIATSPPSDAARALHALFEEQWESWMRENPTWASSLGDRRWNDRWPEATVEAEKRRDRRDRDVLARIDAIDRTRLGEADRLDLDLFRRRVAEDVEERGFRTYLLALNQRGGIQTAHETAESLRFETVKDYDDWLARLRRLPAHIAEVQSLLEEGIRSGMVHPRIVMERVPGQIARQIVDTAENSPFWRTFAVLAPDVAAAEGARIRREAARIILDDLVPAYRALHAFFTGRYLPACRADVGAWALPRGEELYAFRIRRYTTTAMTADAVHELGLAEVARIRREMEQVIRATGFSGDFAAFLEHLRTDPRYYFKTPEELLDAYRAAAKRADPELVKLFGRLPRVPYGVKPIPEATAPDTTTAYYLQPAADGSRAGTYYVNLYRPEVRPKFEIEALTLHEAVPGHHLQIALAQELGELPKFRRHAGYTAFVEGWGLYAESLGSEMGFYQDPLSRFGQLTYEMWRAVRLVVDTGIHARRWDRARAIEYFKANAGKTEHDIVNEIDRYIAWPGQALAYKIGELKIKELRARARPALGERFELRAFHDLVLGSGAIPLDVLEEKVAAWLAGGGKGGDGRAAAP